MRCAGVERLTLMMTGGREWREVDEWREVNADKCTAAPFGVGGAGDAAGPVKGTSDSSCLWGKRLRVRNMSARAE